MSNIFRTPKIVPGDSIPLLCRVLDTSGNVAVQGTFSSIVLDIYDVDDPDNLVVPQVTLSIPAVVFDTLQTDARWRTDQTGYNFAYATLAAHTPRAETEYRFVFTATQTDGRTLKWVFEVPTYDPARAN